MPTVMIPGGRRFLFSYFVMIALAGFALYLLPWTWEDPAQAPAWLDRLFLAVSAISVTGLSTIDPASLSVAGKVLLALLIEAGGLGIITITTLTLLSGNGRLSMSRRKLLGDYFLADLDFKPQSILFKILGYTFFTQFIGSLVIWPWMRLSPAMAGHGLWETWLYSLFHAISAFCNAGFSLFSDNLESLAGSPGVFLPLAVLFVFGGIGFVVIDDVRGFISGKNPRLQLHSRLMIWASLVLLLAGGLVYAALEWNGALQGHPMVSGPVAARHDPSSTEATQPVDTPPVDQEQPGQGRDPNPPGLKLANAFFMAATPRTAGFDTIPLAKNSRPTKLLMIFLMFVGGGAGSTAGGLKVLTFLMLALLLARGLDQGGDMNLGHRRIDGATINRAAVLFVRMVGLLFGAIALLTFTEYQLYHSTLDWEDLVFEAFSAFSTVGLSCGVTSSLSAAGKVVIILTMLAGRVGVTALALPFLGQIRQSLWTYPKEEILLG